MTFGELLTSVFDITLLVTTLRVSASIIIAGMGELITERSGVLNIGIEGVMLIGACFGALGAYYTGSPWIGLLVAMVLGALMGLIHSYISVTLRAEHAISGLALFMLANGLTGFILQVLFSHGGNTPQVKTLPSIHFDFLEGIPVLDKVLNNMPVLVVFALLLPFAVQFLFYKTPWGNWLRATGDNPKAVAAIGKDPIKIRYIATITGSVLAAIGGAYLSISQISLFLENMVAGRGFIALAAVIFGRTKPWPVFFACLFFGFMDALQMTLQIVVPSSAIPNEVFMSMPYVLTVLVLAGVMMKQSGPTDIGQPYIKESR